MSILFSQVQLMVTPKVEGILQISGVRWKLSGSVVGVHKFDSNHTKKKITKGRSKAKHSPCDNLKFLVIKVHNLQHTFFLLVRPYLHCKLSRSRIFVFYFSQLPESTQARGLYSFSARKGICRRFTASCIGVEEPIRIYCAGTTVAELCF